MESFTATPLKGGWRIRNPWACPTCTPLCGSNKKSKYIEVSGTATALAYFPCCCQYVCGGVHLYIIVVSLAVQYVDLTLSPLYCANGIENGI